MVQQLGLMFRVLLKIEKVNLKIIEGVELHILIRKDHRFFTFCKGEPLKNGEALLSHHSAEFLLDAKSPRFEIQIFLISGETRKRGGVVPLNLKAFTINASHHLVEPIRKTPLTHSSLELELVYMQSEYRLEQSLISVERLEQMINTSRIKGVIDEHEKLIFRNNLLNNQVEQLRKRNNDLSKEHRALQHSLNQKEERFHEEMILIEKTRLQSVSIVESDRQRVTEMVKALQREQEEEQEEEAGTKKRKTGKE